MSFVFCKHCKIEKDKHTKDELIQCCLKLIEELNIH